MLQARYWYFGSNAGLDFLNDPPTVLTNGALSTFEGCAAISDISGNLLFYTDGSSVWTKNHLVMPTGTGLNGSSSSTQSAIIVPKPRSNTNYYIFTSSLQAGVGICYSEVDMSLNGGLGDVINKNTLLHAGPMAEKLAAIDHANGTNFWVVTRGGGGTNRLYVNEVTSAGVQPGSTYDLGTTINASGLGALSFSPDGTRLAAALWNGGFELYDFNKSTGVIANVVTLPDGGVGSQAYGVCFSPNSKVLYGSTINSISGVVFQWDLTAANISASKITIGTPTHVTGQSYRGGALQVAINDKMYVAQLGSTFLSVINFPNIIGPGCNFQVDGQTLGTRTCRLGLPPFIQSFTSSSCPEEILRTDCLGDSRIKINKNIACLKNNILALRSKLPHITTWAVNLSDAVDISGQQCIGSSLLNINGNIQIVQNALNEIKTLAPTFLSSSKSVLEEVTTINGTDCVGDSREKLNYNFLTLVSACSEFDILIP